MPKACLPQAVHQAWPTGQRAATGLGCWQSPSDPGCSSMHCGNWAGIQDSRGLKAQEELGHSHSLPQEQPPLLSRLFLLRSSSYCSGLALGTKLSSGIWKHCGLGVCVWSHRTSLLAATLQGVSDGGSRALQT